MQDFTALRNNIMNQYRDVVDRRYYTVTGEKASDEQIDQLIETGEAENLFQKAILAQGRGRVWPVQFFFCIIAHACRQDRSCFDAPDICCMHAHCCPDEKMDV